MEMSGMNNLDRAIADVGYILDVLMAYRNIIQTGDCNTCKIRNECGVRPKPGQLVRYNCAFHKGEGEQS